MLNISITTVDIQNTFYILVYNILASLSDICTVCKLLNVIKHIYY